MAIHESREFQTVDSCMGSGMTDDATIPSVLFTEFCNADMHAHTLDLSQLLRLTARERGKG